VLSDHEHPRTVTDRPEAEKKDIGASDEGGAVDFFRAAAYTTFQAPIDGITQMAAKATGNDWQAPQLISAPEADSYWATAGNVVGSLAQFLAVSKVMRKGLSSTGLAPASGTLSLWEMAATGAAVDLINPVSPNQENFWHEKLRRAGVAGGTFAVMGGTNNYFANHGLWGRAGRRTLAESVTVNTISGATSGFAHAQLDAMSHGHLFADLNEYGSKMGSYALFGAAFGVAERGLYQAAYTLRPPKGYEKFVQKAPSTEDFVLNHYNGRTPLESEILSWIGENRPNLRPPNFADWKKARTERPSNSRELGLQDWLPEQRVEVVKELRRLAGSDLAKDANLDAFMLRVDQARPEVDIFRSRVRGSQSNAELRREWADSSDQMRRLVSSDSKLWERPWTELFTDKKLHADRPDLAQLADRVTAAEKAYLLDMGKAMMGSKVNTGLERELSSIAREMGLPSLNRGFKMELNEAGGSYYHNNMMIGDQRVLSATGRYAEAVVHEMRHHEQGRQMLREFLIAEEKAAVSPGYVQYRARREITELHNGNAATTLDFLKRLGDPETMSHAVFNKFGGMPNNIRTYSEYAHRGEINPVTWNEPAIKGEVLDWLIKTRQRASAENRVEHMNYVGSKVELPAWSVGFLARLRAQAWGLSDAAYVPKGEPLSPTMGLF
jgi:hypothetical protein